ncbi:MAG: glycosyltransferase family 2 protein [Gemmatimonadales bacterium]
MQPSSLSFGLVILNWNNGEDTMECLAALSSCKPIPEKVVVVDNGSADVSLAMVSAWRQDVGQAIEQNWLTVIEAGSNLGFAGGSNLGIRHLLEKTSVTHVMLLNNDAIVSERFFADMRDAISRAPNAGVIGPTIRENPVRERVWYAGGAEYPLRALVKHGLTVPTSSEPRETDFVTGCAMIMSRDVMEKAGLLAECYFPAYFEDGDYCHRARDAGFRVIYAPGPVVYHKVGSTVRAANLDLHLTYHKNRLRVIYARRNYRGATRLAALSYLAFTKPVRALVETLKGRPREGWAVLTGAVSGFTARHIA